jgi:hypothetical protein
MFRPLRRKKKLQPAELRLLHDLAVFHHAMRGERVPARTRLEQRLGADFARSLQASLTDVDARAA